MAGYGEERVLDAFPVAVNLALLTEDVLETENWSSARGEDGQFFIEKKYEWVRSVADANYDDVHGEPSAYTKKTRVLDTYLVNEFGKVEFIAEQVVPDYSAAIFYYISEYKPIDWDDAAPMLQAFCEENGIIFDEVYGNFGNITIRDYKLNDITTVNIAPYLNADSAGIVLLHNKQEPKSVTFASYERMKIELLRYFKIVTEEIHL